MITLDAKIDSDLEWKEGAESIHLDFGFPIDPFNEVHFNSYLLACEEAIKLKPKKIVLLSSDGHFENLFKKTEKLEKRAEESDSELFYTNLTSDYLHRLASIIPEEIIPSLLFNITSENLADMILKLCKRRFEHFSLEFLNNIVPVRKSSSIGVSLPADERFDYKLFNAFLPTLTSYTCIPEELLNENWDGLDILYYDEENTSTIGERMMMGFKAAGGEIKKIRSRGI